MIETIAGLIGTILLALAFDWLFYGRGAASYAYKKADYHLGADKGIVILIFSIYTYWALLMRDEPHRLSPYFLIPSLLLLCAWFIMIYRDVKSRLIDRFDDE